MLSDLEIIADQLKTTNEAHRRSGRCARKNACRTSALIDEFYLCQIDRADCEHAFPYGLNYLCKSPYRKKYSKKYS